MSAKVIPLNNVTRLDLPVDRILEAAKDQLKSVVLLGWDKEGNEYFASSIADGADVLWLLDRCKKKLLEAVDDGYE